MENNLDNQNGNINLYLKEAFSKLGKKQYEVVQDLGVSQSYVSALMAGKKAVGKVVAEKLADLYGFDKGAILTGKIEQEELDEEDETYLRTERNKYDLSLQRIQELTNLPMKKLKAYDNGDENMPDDILEAFENLFQRIENEYNESEEQDDSLPVLMTDDMVSNVKVPFYEVDFAGGFNSPEMFSQVKPSFVISSPSFAGADFACVLTGNSMSKRIKSGSVIGLKEIKEWWEYFPTNEIYAIVTKNGLRTVKIVKRSKKEGYIDLIPDPLPEFNNPSFEMETIRMNYVIGFYQVIAHAFYERMAF
jgi:hypothetical protein